MQLQSLENKKAGAKAVHHLREAAAQLGVTPSPGAALV